MKQKDTTGIRTVAVAVAANEKNLKVHASASEDSDSDLEQPEPLLSPELIQELGGDSTTSNTLVLSSKKKSKRRLTAEEAIEKEDSENAPQEYIEQAKKLNKKQRQRLEQYHKRMDKEARQSGYIQTLQQHEISDAQRQLLTSTRDIGQSATTKQALAKIYRKYKAGLVLTADEEEMLFPANHAEGGDEAAAAYKAELVQELDELLARSGSGHGKLFIPKPVAEVPAVANGIDLGPAAGASTAVGQTKAQSESDTQTAEGPLLLNVFALTADDDENADADAARASKKKKKKSKQSSQEQQQSTSHTSVIASIKPAVPLSFGASLLAQMKSIKAKTSATVPNGLQAETDNGIVDRLGTAVAKHQPFIAQPIADPMAAIAKAVASAAVAPSNVNSTDKDSESKQNVVEEKGQKKKKQKGETVETGTTTTAASGIGAGAYNDTSSTSVPTTSRRYMHVDRDPAIQEARLQLPVCRMEQEIVESIVAHDVVILCGETGSGKSTQVPQFLYEAGFGRDGLIGVTQPRRVAATSTAQRVGVEMGSPVGSLQGKGGGSGLVGYQIRFDASTVGEHTKIKFMTDGILLKEITADLLLRQYSVLLLDEAHERNVNTDVLLGMLSRSVQLRRAQADEEEAKWQSLSAEEREEFCAPIKPLKLVVMSATLRVEDFCNPVLFSPTPPVVEVDARQYPVVTHYARRTELVDYVKEAQRKVTQIHRRLPEGGVLVFLTGKKEVLQTCRKLNKMLNATRSSLLSHDEAVGGDEGEERPSGSGLFGGLDHAEDDDEDDGGRGREAIDDINDDDSDDDDDDDNGDSDLEFEPTEQHQPESSQNPSSRPSKKAKSDGNQSDVSSDDGDRDDIRNSNVVKGDSLRAQMLRQAVGKSATETIHDKQNVNHHATSTSNTLVETAGSQADTLAPTAMGVADSIPSSPPPLKALVLPLFAMMSQSQQAKVFAPPPPGYRLIVVATNVAETSITIPGIRYVVDCGRQKERVLEPVSGISKFEVRWISKASAEQRKGRAGRTGPGHCYRLFSSAFFDQHMVQFKPAEILCTSLEDLLLQMRTMGISDVEHFPFPTMPPKHALKKALDLLIHLGAIVKPKGKVTSILDNTGIGTSTADSKSAQKMLLENGYVSDVGRLLSKFPIGPRFAKMLIVAHRMGVLPHMMSMVAILADKSPFQSFHLPNASYEANDGEEVIADKSAKAKRQALLKYHPEGDALARLRAFGAYVFATSGTPASDPSNNSNKRKHIKNAKSENKEAQSQVEESFCAQHNLVHTSMQKAVDLRGQLVAICGKLFADNGSNSISSPLLTPPTKDQELSLRQALMIGGCDSIAKRAPVGSIKEGSRRKRLTAYLSCNPNVSGALYIHPQSAVYSTDPTADLPEFVVYSSLSYNDKGDTTYMSCVTPVHPSWIPEYVQDCPLLKFSDPLDSPSPYFDKEADRVMCYTVPKYGKMGWELPPVVRGLTDVCTRHDPEIGQTNSSGDNSSIPLGFRKVDEPYRWFARLLLEGAVLPELRGALKRDKLKDSPAIITQMKAQPKVTMLLSRMVSHGVANRATLFAKLARDKTFLSEEIQALLASEHRKEFRGAWVRLGNDLPSSTKGSK